MCVFFFKNGAKECSDLMLFCNIDQLIERINEVILSRHADHNLNASTVVYYTKLENAVRYYLVYLSQNIVRKITSTHNDELQ